jgi:phosphatidylglycerophosphate synthase
LLIIIGIKRRNNLPNIIGVKRGIVLLKILLMFFWYKKEKYFDKPFWCEEKQYFAKNY